MKFQTDYLFRALWASLFAALLLPGFASGQAVSMSDLEQRDEIWYENGGETPFTGMVDESGEPAGRIEDGIMVGRWYGRHDDGVRWITDYESGEQRYHAMFYDDEQMQFEGWYANNRPDSIWREWALNGTLVSETHYHNGAPEGTYTLWNAEGELLYQAEYIGGQLDGPVGWWYEGGQKRWTTSYVKGERSGTWTQWTRDGEIFMQSEWKDDQLVSRFNPHKHDL